MLKHIVAVIALAIGTAAGAVDFKMVVPFGPGSQSDIAARQVAKSFERMTGHNVIVETIPGADSIVGINHFKNSNADIIWHGSSTLVYNVVLKKDLPYDADADFEHVAYVGTAPSVYFVNIGSRISFPRDMIKRMPEFVGSNSSLGPANLAPFVKDKGLKTETANFKSSPDVVIAVANGTLEMGMINVTTSLIELAKGGKIHLVGTTYANDITVDGIKIPSVSKATGITQFNGFTAIAIKPNMDAGRADILRQGLIAAVKDAETQERLRQLFILPDANGDPKWIQQHYRELRARYKTYVQ